MYNYRSGLEIFLEQGYERFNGKRIGLITNHTGQTNNLKPNIDLFYQHPELNLVALFGPEHGVRGNAGAGAQVEDDKDSQTKLPIYSLYGDKKKPTSEMVADIDLLIFDIQDIGVRFYTYISTLFYCLESCAENKKKLLVLDRLNPLGRRVEGNIVKPGYTSFMGLYPIPQRHGMTVGELALWANEEMNIGADLEVIKLAGWNGQWFDEMNIFWIPPSPAIPNFNTALVYPITCLFSGTNISNGRGTANPFEYIGSPWINPFQLNNHLIEKKLSGVVTRPVYFRPTSSKYKDQECGGIQIYVIDRDNVDSYLVGLTILQSLFELYPEKTKFLKPKLGTRYHFDLHMGTCEVRQDILKGKQPVEIINSWKKERDDFFKKRTKYLLY